MGFCSRPNAPLSTQYLIAHHRARTARRRLDAVLSHRLRRNGDARLGHDAEPTSRARRTLAGVRRTHRGDEPARRAVRAQADALGRRHRKRPRDHEADSRATRSSSTGTTALEATFEPYIHNDRQAAAWSRWWRPARATGTRSSRTVDTALPNERASLTKEGCARARGFSNGLARRRRDAVRGDVVSGDLCGGAAWESQDAALDRFAQDFPARSSASTTRAMRSDVRALGERCARLEPPQVSYDQTDALFWADPFAADAASIRPTSICARCGSTRKLVEQNRYCRATALARQRRPRDVLGGAALRCAGAKVSDCGRGARDVRRRARACGDRSRDDAARSLLGAATGCGSCATPTKSSRRSTRSLALREPRRALRQ